MIVAAKSISIAAIAAFCTFFIACSGRGDVDLSKATPLTAEPVASGPAAGIDPNPGTPHGLFSLPPGKWTSFQVLGGVIDPVGTVIEQDFDGDGINNTKETTSNIWVADYPVIESQIAPPVTMRIEVLKTDKSDTTTINTDLTSDNFETRKNEGSEKFHQDEVNVKTINNGSVTDSSSSTSTKDVKASAGGKFFGIGVSVSGGMSSSSSSSTSTVRQTFEDRPFVNNIDRAAQSVKSDAAEKKARDYRAEKRQKKDDEYLTKPDGGIIRAAVYIKNQSINMPVKLSNILCSLVFEAPNGSLIPIQSFRLRNDDFSLFEVEIYGGSEFGPYVVNLPNLNTVEIENALAYGYTPKIFIVDYKMTHVQDSNYRSALGTNFSGDNLKIIEENAKGRTALLKVMYPGYRNMFRIVAFDTRLTPMGTNICNPSHIDTLASENVSPGIHMDKFLNRLKCSGVEIEYGHFIYDFTGLPQAVKYPKVYTYTVKSVNGIEVTAPCTSTEAGVGFNPQTRLYETIQNVCVIKIAALTDEQLNSLSLWATFSNGKYFRSGEIATRPDGSQISFDGVSLVDCGKAGLACGIPVFKGVNSVVWAGDNYDLVYLRMSDYLSKLDKFGINPLETGAKINFNTAWSAKDLGEYPWYPQVRSTYLGQAGVADTIEVKVKLNDTTYLGPNFGTPTADSIGGLAFTDFKYDTRKETSKLFNVREAIDFELNLGLGGEKSDWINLLRDTVEGTSADATKVTSCGQSWNFLQQEFTFCLILPSTPTGVGSERIVNLYLRTSLNNAYRKTIWPQDWRKIRKFDSTLKSIGTSTANNSTIQVDNVIGLAADVTSGNAITVGTNSSSYTISGQPVESPVGSGTYSITIAPALPADEEHKIGERVYVRASSMEVASPQVSYRIDNGFEVAWNSVNTELNPTTGLGMLLTGAYAASNCATNTGWRANHCLGYNQDFQVSNWLGFQAFNNNLNDAQNFSATGINLVLSSIQGQVQRGFFSQSVMGNFNIGPETVQNRISGYNQSAAVVGANGRSLVAWSGVSGITCRLSNLTTGQTIGDDFVISAAPGGAPAVAVSGNTALVVFSAGPSQNNRGIFGRFVNLQTGLPFGIIEFPIHQNYGNLYYLNVVVSGTRAVVVWQAGATQSSANNSIIGRIIDFSTQSTIGPELNLGWTNSIYPQLAASGDYALAVYYDRRNGVTTETYGQVIRISTASVIGGNFQISTTNPTPNINGTILSSNAYATVSANGNSAFVAWLSSFILPDGLTAARQVRGAIVNLPSAARQGGDFLISPSWIQPGSDVTGPNLISGMNATRAMVAWSAVDNPSDSNSNRSVRLRFVNVASGSLLGSTDMILNAPTLAAQNIQSLGLSGNRAIVAWRNAISQDFYMRTVDVANAALLATGETKLSQISTAQTHRLSIGLFGNQGIAAWDVQDADQNHYSIHSRFLDFSPMNSISYGLNNFFTAPLIERNYTVTSRIKF